jgi:hypothetical protein
MPKIFISYRREDSELITGRIYDRLESRFGRKNVFRDMDSILLGVDFRERISGAVGDCDVLLAIIGTHWLDVCYREGTKQGHRRLDDPDDFVNLEIRSALTRGIPVIPVLVGGARMPRDQELPEGLVELAYRNATEVASGQDFHHHVDRLIQGIGHVVPRRRTWAGPGQAVRAFLSRRWAMLGVAMVSALVLSAGLWVLLLMVSSPKGGGTGTSGHGRGDVAVTEKGKADGLAFGEWTIILNTANGDDYARQLESLGAILTIPDPNNHKNYLVIRDLRQRPAQPKPEDVSKLRLFWSKDDRPDSLKHLSAALGLNPIPSHVIVYFPDEFQEKLRQRALNFLGLKAEQIKFTTFEVRLIGGTYEPVVKKQDRK